MEDILAKIGLRCKLLRGPVLISLIIILVATAAFGLGRLSALGQQRGTLKIHPPGDLTTLALPTSAPTVQRRVHDGPKNFVASKNGTKYYSATCASASRIKPQNQVWFASSASAALAGYSPALNCIQN